MVKKKQQTTKIRKITSCMYKWQMIRHIQLVFYVGVLSTAALFFYGRHRIHLLVEMSNTIYKFMFKLTSAFHIFIVHL